MSVSTSISLSSMSPDDFVSATNLFENADWLKVVQKAYPFSYYASEAAAGKQVVWAKSDLSGFRKMVSLPYSDYTLPALPVRQLKEHLRELTEENPEACFDLRFACLQTDMESQACQYAWLHRVDLSRKSFNANFLRNLRKAQRSGLQLGESQAYEDFTFFCETLRLYRRQKFGVLSPPDAFFEAVYQTYIASGKGKLYTVVKEGKAISWALVLFQGQEAYYKWGCSLPEFSENRPNNLLFYEMQHRLYEAGFDQLDLGLSFKEDNEGLIRFKSAMGGWPFPICRLQQTGSAYPAKEAKRFSGLLNEMASVVVKSNLSQQWRNTFSEVLYPLFG